jgi:hypothetical protein
MAKAKATKSARKAKKGLRPKGKPIESVKTLGQVVHPMTKI